MRSAATTNGMFLRANLPRSDKGAICSPAARGGSSSSRPAPCRIRDSTDSATTSTAHRASIPLEINGPTAIEYTLFHDDIANRAIGRQACARPRRSQFDTRPPAEHNVSGFTGVFLVSPCLPEVAQRWLAACPHCSSPSRACSSRLPVAHHPPRRRLPRLHPPMFAPTAVVAQREATVAPPPTPTPAPTARTGSPAAKLSRQAPDGECRRVIYMYLTGFAPDSVVTVDGSYDELVCGTGAAASGALDQGIPRQDRCHRQADGQLRLDGTGSYWMPIQSTGPDNLRNSAS